MKDLNPAVPIMQSSHRQQRVEIWKERARGLIGRPGCLQFIHQLVPAQAAVDPVIWVAKHPNSAWLYLRNKYLL